MAISKPIKNGLTSTTPNLVPVGRDIVSTSKINTQTLDSLMTAGYGDTGDLSKNPSHTSNPPAYPGTYGGNPSAQPQRLGVIRNVPGVLGKQQIALYFIFNPNEIVVQFETSQSQIPYNYIYGVGPNNPGSLGSYSGSKAIPNITSAQSVSWSLIFDRTYDMLYTPNANTNADVNRGVLRDTAALYNLMGTFEGNSGTPYSTPCRVIFGRNGGPSNNLFGFTGFISGVEITYGIFRNTMIPSRAEVDITMTAVYIAASTPPGPADPKSTKTTTKAKVTGGQNGSTGAAVQGGGPVGANGPTGPYAPVGASPGGI
jgi:hypothetical protein